mmetsp:Transcript_22202/g.50720  ORF Transcript_22202/g.50720 Transcript_22202/m.50720 type:complete len:165 (-) Transcript_22202:108-602(-)
MDWLMLIGALMLTFVLCCLWCFVTGLYQYWPYWGPVVKFDGHGDETLRLNQFLIHEHAAKIEREKCLESKEKGPNGEKIYRGSTAIPPQPTWGKCEAPEMRDVPIVHPVYGKCTLKEGFSETQKLREESDWWAKDEPHFMKQHGEYTKPADINDLYYVAPRCMV